MLNLYKFKKWLNEDEAISQDVRKLITSKIAEYIELNSTEAKLVKKKTHKAKAIVDKIS